MSYRLQAKNILLTYSQVDNDDAFLRTPSAHFDHCTSLLGPLDVYRLGREFHQDGGTHFHAYVSPSNKCSTRNARLFDYAGYHPNVRPVRKTPWKSWDYVGKEHDVIYEHGERPGGDRAPDPGRQSVWSDALAAGGKEEFLRILREKAPREYVLYHDAIERFVEKHYAPVPPHYESPSFETDSINLLSVWLHQSNIGGERWPGRPRSLILWGPTRTGKTVWARSLGRYVYRKGMHAHPTLNPLRPRAALGIPSNTAASANPKPTLIGDVWVFAYAKPKIGWVVGQPQTALG